MKSVVFFGCAYQDIRRLVDIHKGRYKFIAIVNDDHFYSRNYPESDPDFEFVHVGFKNFFQLKKVAKSVFPKSHYLIVHRESMVPYAGRLSEFFSDSMRKYTPSGKVMITATDKGKMREAFRQHATEYSAQFVDIACSDSKFNQKVMSVQLKFPLIVKPANNMASLYVQAAKNMSELMQIASRTRQQLLASYKTYRRYEPPRIIIEEFLEGDMYTLGSWVTRRNNFFHAPLVKVLTARDIGREGFFLFARYTFPVNNTLVREAREAAEAAMTALGLTYSSAHIELIKTKSGFKIIEIGPRVGGYRQWMYLNGVGIDSYENDFLIRVGKNPNLNERFSAFTASIEVPSDVQGNLSNIVGLKTATELSSYDSHSTYRSIGEEVKPVYMGGKHVVSINLKNKSFESLYRDIETIREIVSISVD